MGRKETARRLVDQSALMGAGLGLLPFRFAAPAIAAVGLKVIKDVRTAYETELDPVEQAISAAVLGASQFALGQSTRAARLVPYVGPVLSAVLTGAAIKAFGEGAIAYFQFKNHTTDATARPVEATGEERQVDFS